MVEFQAEVCHILFTLSVDYTESAELASIPPAGYTELPTCPVCLGESLANLYILFIFLYIIFNNAVDFPD